MLLAVLACALPASAKPPPVQAAPRRDFWREMLEPHGEEVKRIVTLATQHVVNGDASVTGDADPTGRQRARYYRLAHGMLRYARHLSPENVDVLRLLGHVADELGNTEEARGAFETAVRIAGAEKAGPDITGGLGAIYLRLGKVDAAIRYLRLAQGPLDNTKPISAVVLVHLAHALAARGDMASAIDTLANAMPTSSQYYSNEMALVAFALAIQYDRDEQAGAAFEVIDHMQTQLTSSFDQTVATALLSMRFAPAEDRHYYQALLYEVMGYFTEARAEWALYAAADMPFRARAEAHIAAIDAMRRSPPRAKKPKPVVTP